MIQRCQALCGIRRLKVPGTCVEEEDVLPYEIVRAAIDHRGPPRLPVRFPCFGCNDTAGLPLKPAASFVPAVEGEDEWGCVWAKSEMANMGQVKGHPLTSIADLKRSKHPDYGDDSRYEDSPAALEEAQREGKYVTAGIFMVLFERMHTRSGFENVLCDLMLDRPAMERLADHIVDVHLELVENVYRRFGDAVHGFTMTDDWGTQQAAFVRYDLWTDFFMPRYKRLFDAMHAGGYDVWVHSCGKVNEIVEGYIRAGVTVVNLQQPRALGIREMGDRYRGRIAFESLADIQHTLPTGDLGKVDADAADLMTHWALPTGGFVFSDYGDDEAIGVRDPQVKLHMYQRFSEWSERLYGNPLPTPQIQEAS
jgi:uroporphyrinogen decarboxylase